MRLFWLVALTFGFGAPAVSGVLQAQASDPASPLCFVATPRPDCAAFLLTELAVAGRRFGEGHSTEHSLQWELGAMYNLTAQDALGASAVLGPPARVTHRGVNVRYRRWINPRIALDLAPGVVWVREDSQREEVRGTAQATVGTRHVALFVSGGDRADDRLAVGVKLGAWPGAVLGALAYGLLAIQPET